MRKLIRIISCWHSYRIYNRWFTYYLEKGYQPLDASNYACKILKDLEYKVFYDWHGQLYCGINPEETDSHG